jgi:hypothetical protein
MVLTHTRFILSAHCILWVSLSGKYCQVPTYLNEHVELLMKNRFELWVVDELHSLVHDVVP